MHQAAPHTPPTGPATATATATAGPQEAQAAPSWRRLWPHVSPAQWADWHWQQAHRIRTRAQLQQFLMLSADESAACDAAAASFPMAITPYYLSLIDPTAPADPIRLQAIPSLAELHVHPSECADPLAEEAHMPVPGLTHRYPDRVLLYTTHNCPVYCRHCNRKRKVGQAASATSRSELATALSYIGHHPEVRDVLLSGGDPLTFSDARLEELLHQLRAIAHVEMIRLATRNPVTLPQRITPELAHVLQKYHPIFVNTHFNHIRECTLAAGAALEQLANAGCVVSNQMVLLQGINTDAAMVKAMNQWLLRHRCRPYYIFQCDAANGIAHFRTSTATGISIISQLRGWTSGLAVPHYVVDLPGGGGKVSLQPDYLQNKYEHTLTFRNYSGELFTYEEG